MNRDPGSQWLHANAYWVEICQNSVRFACTCYVGDISLFGFVISHDC